MAVINSQANKANSGNIGAGLIATNVISGLTDIATGYINSKRVKNTYEFNARMAELQGGFNAAMAGLQGRMTRLSADIEIANIRDKAMSLYSTQRAAYAKAGVKMEGSPIEVMQSSLRDAELDAIYADISATYNVGLTETQAGIYRTEAQMQAGIYKMQGKSALADANINAFKTILNTGTDIYKTYSLTKLKQGK